MSHRPATLGLLAVGIVLLLVTIIKADAVTHARQAKIDAQIDANAQSMVSRGRQIFRDDTFGSEAFWGDAL